MASKGLWEEYGKTNAGNLERAQQERAVATAEPAFVGGKAISWGEGRWSKGEAVKATDGTQAGWRPAHHHHKQICTGKGVGQSNLPSHQSVYPSELCC